METMDLDRASRAQLVSRIDDLEAELEAIRCAHAPATEMQIQSALGLSPYECRLVSLMRDGKARTKEQILFGLYSHRIDDPPEIKIIDVYICKTRKKLERFGIYFDTIWGSGYVLRDPDGALAAIERGEPVLPVETAVEPAPVMPHLFKRNHKADLGLMLATLSRRAREPGGTLKFTSREIAAASGIRRPAVVILRWLERSGSIQIIKAPLRGGRSGAWEVVLLHADWLRQSAA